MRRRQKMSRKKSRKNFSRNSGVHPKNKVRSGVSRGGIRL